MPAARRQGHLWAEIKSHRWHYAFLTPMVVLAALFTFWPIVATALISFFDWDGYEPLTEFVGLANFTEAVTSAQFWNAFRNTFIFTAFAVFIQMPLALSIAVLLNNSVLRGRNVYRVLIFLPVVTTTAVVGVVFAVLLDPNGGTVNTVLQDTGLVDEPVNFLGEEALALPTVLVVDMWKNLGITMVYFLAALQTIPAELYDAAKVDGASRWQSFRYVTLPLIRPLALIILLLTVVMSFNAFDLVQTMTAGGPNYATDIIPTYIYRYAFNPERIVPRYGLASAAALFFGIAVIVLTVLLVVPARRARLQRDAGIR